MFNKMKQIESPSVEFDLEDKTRKVYFKQMESEK